MQNNAEASQEWQSLVDGYRDLGGTINNIVQKRGVYGLGLFPIDPNHPIELIAPAELLVPVDQLKLVDGQLTLADPSRFPPGYTTWFETFQRQFSWGADGRCSIITFETQLGSLPNTVQHLLEPFSATPLAQRLAAMDDRSILQRFINTRRISWKEDQVLMPMIELVNHSADQSSFNMRPDGIRISGSFDDEVMVRYSIADPLTRFLQYGFSCTEPTAFSKHLRGVHRGVRFAVIGGHRQKPLQPLEVLSHDQKLTIKQPLLGCRGSIKAPKILFRKAFSSIKGVEPDELFEQIVHANRLHILNLLKEIDSINQPLIPELKQACLNQLLALNLSLS